MEWMEEDEGEAGGVRRRSRRGEGDESRRGEDATKEEEGASEQDEATGEDKGVDGGGSVDGTSLKTEQNKKKFKLTDQIILENKTE